MVSSPKKLILGWFTFTCCEDSTILMTELLNQHWQTWLQHFDFKYAKVLRPVKTLGPMDVAFVEGAITSDEQAQKLKQIRSLAKQLVAIGACAVTGQPAGQRNYFDPDRLKEIQPIIDRFQFSPQAQPLAKLVTVDHQIPGCPMDEAKFLDYINQLINSHAST